jgi:hypothetical protein
VTALIAAATELKERGYVETAIATRELNQFLAGVK